MHFSLCRLSSRPPRRRSRSQVPGFRFRRVPGGFGNWRYITPRLLCGVAVVLRTAQLAPIAPHTISCPRGGACRTRPRCVCVAFAPRDDRMQGPRCVCRGAQAASPEERDEWIRAVRATVAEMVRAWRVPQAGGRAGGVGGGVARSVCALVESGLSACVCACVSLLCVSYNLGAAGSILFTCLLTPPFAVVRTRARPQSALEGGSSAGAVKRTPSAGGAGSGAAAAAPAASDGSLVRARSASPVHPAPA